MTAMMHWTTVRAYLFGFRLPHCHDDLKEYTAQTRPVCTFMGVARKQMCLLRHAAKLIFYLRLSRLMACDCKAQASAMIGMETTPVMSA